MEETTIVVDGLAELIQILTDNAGNTELVEQSGQIVELLTENNGYIDTEIYDLVAALNHIDYVLTAILGLMILVLSWRLAHYAVSFINAI